MNSLQRTLTALGQQEPDRVPLFLLVTLHGARQLGLSIEEYFSRAEHVVEGQLRMRERYGHDSIYGFFHAAIEVEAWGGEVLYFDDGPPNAGAPIIRRPGDIDNLTPPDPAASPVLAKVLDAQRGLKERLGDEAPIIGVAISPFSLPVMQMGFEAYLELMYRDEARFWKLMEANQRFVIDWANAQLDAGATAICYFDPVSSCTVVSPERYRETGRVVAGKTLPEIKGPTATHFASGRCLPIVDDVISTGTAVLGVSVNEDLAELKAKAAGRASLLGNLNGVEMANWSPEQAEAKVKEAIAKAGRGGGLLLGDNHGEIPWQVPETVLEAIGEAVRRWGRYPLEWVDDAS